MKILGAGSLASRLRVVLDLVVIGMLVLGALNALLLLILLIEPTHPLQRLTTMTTLYSVPHGFCPTEDLLRCTEPGALTDAELLAFVNYRPGSRWFLAAVGASYFVWWGLWLVVVLQLRRVFQSLTSGQPFLGSNVRRLRVIGWAIIAGKLFEHAADFGLVSYMRTTLMVGGERPVVPPVLILADIRLEMLFVGAAVLVLAEIFRLGAALHEEQALTV